MLLNVLMLRFGCFSFPPLLCLLFCFVLGVVCVACVGLCCSRVGPFGCLFLLLSSVVRVGVVSRFAFCSAALWGALLGFVFFE